MFRSYRDLVRTPKQATNTTQEIYNCNLCDRGGWCSENDVEVHKKEIHFLQMQECRAKNKERFCTVCMTLLDTNEDLIEHIKTQHLLSSPKAKRVERKIYICNECTNIFFNKDVLATHMLYVHIIKKWERGDKHFTCPKCSKKCSLKSVWFHFQKHDIPSVSMCDICLDNFPSRAVLREHMKTHKGYFKCEPCGYNSSQLTPLEVHLQMHAQKKIPNGKVSMQVLNTVFMKHRDSFVRYNLHNTLKGLSLPRFMEICTLCREICVSRGETKLHILRDHIHELEKKKMHLCVCGEEFYYKVVLKQHVMKTKGHHQPLEETSVQTNPTVLPAKKKPIILQRKTLQSLLKYNKVAAAGHREDDRHSDEVQMNAQYTQNEGENSDEDVKSNIILIKTEADMVDKKERNPCNMITIEISNQIIDHMDYTAGHDKMAMAVHQENKST